MCSDMKQNASLTTEADFRDLLPPQTQTEYAQMLENLKAEPESFPKIKVWGNYKGNNVILDGHHQYKARIKLGLPIRMGKEVVKLDFADRMEALRYSWKCQRGRRNATDSQLAMAAAKLVTTTGRGRPAKNTHECIITTGEAADMVGVSTRTVASAAQVRRDGSERLVGAVEAGDITVKDAAAIVELPKGDQNRALAPVVAGNAGTLVEAAETLPKKRKSKPGKEILPAALRKKTLSDFGRLSRGLQAMKRREKCIDALTHILAVIKA